MTTYRPRELGTIIAKSRESLPVVVVTGLRQVGKTTLLASARGLRTGPVVTLDDLAALSAARRDPAGFVRGKSPMTIDEVQKCPRLLSGIKMEVDRHRRNGMFMLTGSANLALLRGVTESLAGRAIYHELEPMSRRELGRTTGRPPFLRAFFETGVLPTDWSSRVQPVQDLEVLAGGLPSVALGSVDRRTWFTGYEQTYLERDLRSLSQVADLGAFQRVMRLAALRTGRILSKSSIAKDAELGILTTRRYLKLLGASFVIRELGPYLANRVSRIVKSPKVLVTDSGLACHLAGVDDAAALRRNPEYGFLLETYAAHNLRAIASAHWPRAQFHYWHVQGRHEVDLVIADPAGCLAIEIKAADRWTSGDFRHLDAFVRQHPECRAGILAFNGSKPEQLNPKLWAIPLGLLLG